MSSIREIKKDIRYLTEQVIIDALELSEVLEVEEDKKKAVDVIVQVVDLHNNLLSRVNNPDGKNDPKLVKIHYKTIMKDLMDSCNKAYENLNQLIKD
jgi:hypothetical protein